MGRGVGGVFSATIDLKSFPITNILKGPILLGYNPQNLMKKVPIVGYNLSSSQKKKKKEKKKEFIGDK